MFVLMVLKDTLRIPANELTPKIRNSMHDHINQKYANKVLANQGLCIGLHGIDNVGPPIIYGGDGAAHIRIQFRLIIFRPFASEVIVGKVKACDATGILVSVEFFDHIFIPAAELQQPSRLSDNDDDTTQRGTRPQRDAATCVIFTPLSPLCVFFSSSSDTNERLWVWNYQDHDLFLDLGEEIRIRVTGIEFARQSGGPMMNLTEEEIAAAAPGGSLATVNAQVIEAAAAKKSAKKATIANFEPPMKVIGSIRDDGLGLLAWWD